MRIETPKEPKAQQKAQRLQGRGRALPQRGYSKDKSLKKHKKERDLQSRSSGPSAWGIRPLPFVLHALMMTVEDSAFESPSRSTVAPSPCSSPSISAKRIQSERSPHQVRK
jgi:hypothetical protein